MDAGAGGDETVKKGGEVMKKKTMLILTGRDCQWWDLLRANCRYRNGYGKCISRPNHAGGGYIRCESQGCPILKKTIAK